MLLVYHECWEEILFREDWECWRFIGPKCGSYFSWTSVLIKSSMLPPWSGWKDTIITLLLSLALHLDGRGRIKRLLDISQDAFLTSTAVVSYEAEVCYLSEYRAVWTLSVWIQPWGHIYPLALPIQALYFKGYPRIALWLAVGGDDHVTPGLIILSHLDTTFLEVDVNNYSSTRVKDLFFIISSISPPPFKIAPCACTPQGWRVLTIVAIVALLTSSSNHLLFTRCFLASIFINLHSFLAAQVTFRSAI